MAQMIMGCGYYCKLTSNKLQAATLLASFYDMDITNIEITNIMIVRGLWSAGLQYTSYFLYVC